VDDSGFSRSVIAGLFTQASAGCEVTQAANGQEAIGQVEDAPSPFTLITVDIHMPGMDGFELVRELKKRGVTSRISLVSANVQDTAKARAAELGVSFVGKPLNLAKVAGLLKELAL
jgi:CheY-like chemotaxis protein